MLRRIFPKLVIAWFIALFIAGFLAYMVSSSGPGGPHDGLGRPLSVSPWAMRFFFGQDHLWAGWGWFVGDMAIFWGSIALGLMIWKRLEKE